MSDTTFRDSMDDTCQTCGKSIPEADEIVPEAAGWHIMHGFTGRWTCGECVDSRNDSTGEADG